MGRKVSATPSYSNSRVASVSSSPVIFQYFFFLVLMAIFNVSTARVPATMEAKEIQDDYPCNLREWCLPPNGEG